MSADQCNEYIRELETVPLLIGRVAEAAFFFVQIKGNEKLNRQELHRLYKSRLKSLVYTRLIKLKNYKME